MCTQALTRTHVHTQTHSWWSRGALGSGVPGCNPSHASLQTIPGRGLASTTSTILCKLGERTPNVQASMYRRWTMTLQPSGCCTLLHTHRALLCIFQVGFLVLKELLALCSTPADCLDWSHSAALQRLDGELSWVIPSSFAVSKTWKANAYVACSAVPFPLPQKDLWAAVPVDGAVESPLSALWHLCTSS